MKIIVPLSLFALAACTAPAADDTSTQTEPPSPAAAQPSSPAVAQPSSQTAAQPSMECDAGAGQYAVGKPFTDALAAELKKKVGAASLRIIPPGTMVTMDYSPHRLNIGYDDKKVITKVDCG